MKDFLIEGIERLNRDIANEIKKRLVQNITKKLVDDFKKEAEEVVKHEVMRLSVEEIKVYHDILQFKDIMEIQCYWNNKKISSLENRLTKD